MDPRELIRDFQERCICSSDRMGLHPACPFHRKHPSLLLYAQKIGSAHITAHSADEPSAESGD